MIIAYYIFLPHRSVWYSLGWKSLSSLSFLLVATVVMGQCTDASYRIWIMTGLILDAMSYAIVILYMELCAMQHLAFSGYGILLNIGTLCFVLSDLILAFILFKNQNTKGMVRWNLSLYYVAQVCILSTMWLY